MSANTADPERQVHEQWLGLLQLVGLVVSPAALVRSRVTVDLERAADLQTELERLVDVGDPHRPAVLPDLSAFFESVLGWRRDEYVGGGSVPESLTVRLPDFHELLRPSHAVPDRPRRGRLDDGPSRWLLIAMELPPRTELDAPDDGSGWHAPPQVNFERMLRELDVAIGLLSNGETLRLVYAPRGESAGHLSFPIGAMLEPVNHPMLGALHMLLSADRLFDQPEVRRLPALLELSRKHEIRVWSPFAEQVLGALNELLRGFQLADEATAGELLGSGTNHDLQHVHGGLLTVLMRLVFLLYVEARGLMSDDSTSPIDDSVGGLFERLSEDAGRYPDTMDERHGAWAKLLSLFRSMYVGAGRGWLPALDNPLFDPDAYPFLEGRSLSSTLDPSRSLQLPQVSDGTIHRVLRSLLVIEGERLAYHALDPEQIGSIYGALLGYVVARCEAPSIGLGRGHIVISVADLLAEKPGMRGEWLRRAAGIKLDGPARDALKEARTPEQAVSALERRLSTLTPKLLPKGAFYLQPDDDRRRDGQCDTPRALTEPIVRTALQPVLGGLGPRPTAEQILALRVCDPAMGSGAFLLEVCRQLAEQLVGAWVAHEHEPQLPRDEDLLVHARRLVAERCLYGVDKNPFVVDLAKLSIGLLTLAKDRPLVSLDHALRCGDSLVGLTCKQIAAFRWDDVDVSDEAPLAWVHESVAAAAQSRRNIQHQPDAGYGSKQQWSRDAERQIGDVRLQGDAIIAVFVAEERTKDREQLRIQLWGSVQRWQRGDAAAKAAVAAFTREILDQRGITPFHWELELVDEVEHGFDVIVGNPPFRGWRMLSPIYREYTYGALLGGNGNSDLVACFLRRSFQLLARSGVLGLVAPVTISQGQTRTSGLSWICMHGGRIIHAARNLAWPGDAAVAVTLVHVQKNGPQTPAVLDGRPVARISAFLSHTGPDTDPARLDQNSGACFRGSALGGRGFLFGDDSSSASSVAKMNSILADHPGARDFIRPYMSATEINTSPDLRPTNWAIALGQLSLGDAELQAPQLVEILRATVKPERESRVKTKQAAHRATRWWQWHADGTTRAALTELPRFLVNSQVSNHLAFVFLPAPSVPAHTLNVFAYDEFSSFAVLQSRVHEVWARFFGSSLNGHLRYDCSECFGTFPFPGNWRTAPLESVGRTYYEFRTALMAGNDEGLTRTYNRFHDSGDRSEGIMRLRDLHTELDRAVLETYGWLDLAARVFSAFELDHEGGEVQDGAGRRRAHERVRYRWPHELEDEVLARLLELNRRYAHEQRLAGASASEESDPRAERNNLMTRPTASSDPGTPTAREPRPLRFVAIKRSSSPAWPHADAPYVLLEQFTWDDAGYRTLYRATHVDGETRTELGLVKIAPIENDVLEARFERLDERFCSLGQNWSYYQTAKQLGIHEALLSGLRDYSVLDSETRAQLADRPAVASLLRFASARHALARCLGEHPGPYRFTLRHRVEGFAETHEVRFDFDEQQVRGRVVVLVGENGTGKTRFLRGLVMPLLGIREFVSDERVAAIEAPELVPRFSFILMVSFSTFDSFEIPRFPIHGNLTQYAGLRRLQDRWGERASVSIEQSLMDLEDVCARLAARGRRALWLAALAEHRLEPPEHGFAGWLGNRSAGQKFVCFVLSYLYAFVDEQALVIFDEPEIHCHPSMLSVLMRQLHRVLEDFNAYAVVATHSPIVLQETPARQVRVFRRHGAYPRIASYPGECFAEDLNEIVRLGFGMDIDRRNFVHVLKQLVSEHGVDEVERKLGRMGIQGAFMLELLRAEDLSS